MDAMTVMLQVTLSNFPQLWLEEDGNVWIIAGNIFLSGGFCKMLKNFLFS